ncbi:response regulator transcription factor [uncultured Clostridium sp.]|uniref:response regulator transcription factor n=1 Tax=uncultured Clostridium sp. TaxID=59620 RepID=UPI00258C3DF0|nr:response regulator transcription factor [uncultured Clostridium sp.]
MIKILFLEDEPNILEVTTEYMKMQGYDVTCVSNGADAIEMLKSYNFNLAVLDIMVPKVTGLEVLEYINENKRDIATIMLTALGDEQTQLKAFNLKTDDYVIKPFSPLLLLKRIEAVLRRSLTEKKYDENTEFYIDDKTYQAYYKGQSLNLTLSEFLLLQTLINEPDRVFNREQLIMKIFNEDYISNDRIIDAHVKNLRKKLPYNYIKTVIGVGYQFNKEDNQ